MRQTFVACCASLASGKARMPTARATANAARLIIVQSSAGHRSCATREIEGKLLVKKSFYDLVRPRQQRRRDRQPERLRGLEVDDEIELRRLLDGKIGGLG